MADSKGRGWDLDPDLEETLLNRAWEAREGAYAPYSSFKVGAALLTKGGRIFTGCNVENSTFGLTMCAERVAVFKALSEGERDFRALAIVSSSSGPVAPCGACLQVLFEFSGELVVVSEGRQGDLSRWYLSELLPQGFTFRGGGKG